MARRIQLNFHRSLVGSVEENGQPRPCALGVAWVNADTLATLEVRRIPRTDPYGKPLADDSDESPASA